MVLERMWMVMSLPVFLLCSSSFSYQISSAHQIRSSVTSCFHSNYLPRQKQLSSNSDVFFQTKAHESILSSRKSRVSIILSASARDENESRDGRPSVSISGISSPLNNQDLMEGTMSPTAALDFILSLITSDIGSIILGLIGLTICLFNRLSTISTMEVDALGQQSRADLLAVFASGAVLLNGISKLDVTSALAETVTLDGIKIAQPEISDPQILKLSSSQEKDVFWGINSFLEATPAKTVVLMVNDGMKWSPFIFSGIVPPKMDSIVKLPISVRTPILDRLLDGSTKESYLPTLQALPGKVEFVYLPQNTQEALLLPIPISNDFNRQVVVVLGSDTAKSFSPRDVAWCQAIATRMGTFIGTNDDNM